MQCPSLNSSHAKLDGPFVARSRGNRPLRGRVGMFEPGSAGLYLPAMRFMMRRIYWIVPAISRIRACGIGDEGFSNNLAAELGYLTGFLSQMQKICE